MSKIAFLLFMLLAVNECTSAQQVHPEPPKNPSSQPLLPHGRSRRDEPELTTPTTTTPGKSSTEDEEKDDKNSSELNRDKREEDDDTPMHDGEELDEEGDKSDVGLESAAKNDTETTGEPSTDGEGAEEQQQQETVQENLEIARKKRDENQTENMDGGEQVEQTHVEESSGNQTAEDGLRSRNRRASATNNKAKMAVKSTKTAAAGGQRGPRGLETGPLE
ncbi:hypothetical protein niasHS_000785 [Heterodera schachtii]|uniref:Uncharacterized protein n=1 Tax=Heterodera schachtii TaxID=97005 RepID=A0ABD2KIR5_HETSC